MAKKIHMVATVAGFELTRSTSTGKAYAAAWCVVNEHGALVTYGFSSSIMRGSAEGERTAKHGSGRSVHVETVTVMNDEAFKTWLADRPWRIYRSYPDGRKEMMNLSGNLPYRFKSEAAARKELETGGWSKLTDGSRWLVQRVK